MSSSSYPTKQEIIDRMSEIDIQQAITTLEDWKRDHFHKVWKKKTTSQKLDSLTVLAYRMYYEVLPSDETKMLQVIRADRYALHLKSNTIILDNSRASILSTLHELGHAIHGASELEACAFSIKLFAKVFPTEYSKLEWHGHMLRLPRK